jgi:peroxidase
MPYSNIDDVDLFVMGLAERPLKGAMVGETFACLLSRQFQAVL